MIEKRINELMGMMNSFPKEKYQREEMLTEMFNLQAEVVELTFNEEHASIADLKLWDVEKHLKQLNSDCDNVASEELGKFISESRELSNMIKAEVSGNRGEMKAFHVLDLMNTHSHILKNVELNNGEQRTELDMVVITSKGITIVEVKNTARDIFIDEKGDYYRTGRFLRWDSNIGEKIALKEELLRDAISESNLRTIPINSIVVFTNNLIKVENRYEDIKTCFVSQLTAIIDSQCSDQEISVSDMAKIKELIVEAECKEEYPIKFDVNQYKLDFATVMAILEEASAKKNAENEEDEVFMKERKVLDISKHILKSKHIGYFGSAAAAVVATVVVVTTRKRL